MRRFRRPLLAVTLLLFVASLPLHAQGAEGETKTEGKTEKKGRLGMFIRLRASSLRVSNEALFVAVRDEPGDPFAGDVVDASWNQRISPEIQIGFVLPGRQDMFRIQFAQFDQTLDIGEDGIFRNTWASRLAGVDEDLDGDGDVNGFDCTDIGTVPGSTLPCEADGADNPSTILDGAEDRNFNGVRDFLRFTHSDSVISQIQTEVLTVDADYARPLKDTPGFLLEGSVGLRYARVSQSMDLTYRRFGSFGAYTDDEDDSTYRQGGMLFGEDADGDGLNPMVDQNTGACSRDCVGDGWGNGNSGLVKDNLLNVPTVDQDIIRAKVETSVYGVTLGLRGEYSLASKRLRETTAKDFRRRWALESSVRLGLLQGHTDFSFRETLLTERDAFPNFINWDLNNDGVFGDGPAGHDFDCNGDGIVNSTDWNGTPCVGALAGLNLGSLSLTGAAPGLSGAVKSNGQGYTPNPYGDGTLDPGDPVPESERNTTIVRETQVVRNLSGTHSGEFYTSLDLDLGVRWYFSRFADISFGARASRWFDVGNIKNVRSDTSADELTNGDLTLSGVFVTLTVRPRF